MYRPLGRHLPSSLIPFDELLTKPTMVTYVHTLAPQQGVSGGDENASTYYVPATQRMHAQGVRGAEEGQYQGSTTATMPRYASAYARYLSIQ